MQRDVFISHQHSDARFARALCDELERQGILCWIAPRNIRPGDSWRASIVTAVESTSVMVLVFSSNTQVSSQVLKELSIADNSKRTVVPLLLEDLEPQGEYKYQLTGRHWIKAFGGGATAVKEAAQQIRWYLESRNDMPAARRKPGQPPSMPHRPMHPSPPAGGSWSQNVTRNVMLVAGFMALLALAVLGFKAAFFQEERGGINTTVAPVSITPASTNSAGQAPANPQQDTSSQQSLSPELSSVSASTGQYPAQPAHAPSAAEQTPPKLGLASPSEQVQPPSNRTHPSSADVSQVAPPQVAKSASKEPAPAKEPGPAPESKPEKRKSVNNLFRPPN